MNNNNRDQLSYIDCRCTLSFHIPQSAAVVRVVVPVLALNCIFLGCRTAGWPRNKFPLPEGISLVEVAFPFLRPFPPMGLLCITRCFNHCLDPVGEPTHVKIKIKPAMLLKCKGGKVSHSDHIPHVKLSALLLHGNDMHGRDTRCAFIQFRMPHFVARMLAVELAGSTQLKKKDVCHLTPFKQRPTRLLKVCPRNLGKQFARLATPPSLRKWSPDGGNILGWLHLGISAEGMKFSSSNSFLENRIPILFA